MLWPNPKISCHVLKKHWKVLEFSDAIFFDNIYIHSSFFESKMAISCSQNLATNSTSISGRSSIGVELNPKMALTFNFWMTYDCGFLWYLISGSVKCFSDLWHSYLLRHAPGYIGHPLAIQLIFVLSKKLFPKTVKKQVSRFKTIFT